MDTRVLLETPHRSVHWSLLGKLRASTAKGSAEQRFAEWKKLLSWEVAAKAPHVFTEAVGHVADLVLSGRLEVSRAAQALVALAAAPPSGARGASAEYAAVPAVVQALVRLVAAGADQLAPLPGRCARDGVLRSALERNPALWAHVIQNIRDLVAPESSGEHSDSAADQDPDVVWGNVRAFLRFAVVDPTVPAWAQGKAIDAVFSAVHELAHSDSTTTRRSLALTVLEWAVDVAADMAQPVAQSGSDPECTFYTVDQPGRCGPSQMAQRCVRAAALLCSLDASAQPGPEARAARLASVVDRLRLLVASMSIVSVPGPGLVRQTQSPRAAGDRAALAACQAQLLATGLLVDERWPGSIPAGAACAPTDVAVWLAIACRIASAASAAEQAHLLKTVVAMQARRDQASRVPAAIAAVMRLPLLCVAADGFTADISAQALRACEDLERSAQKPDVGAGAELGPLAGDMGALCAQKWACGALPLLVSALCDYVAVCAAAGRPSALGGVAGLVEAVAGQPLLVAPLLFGLDGRGRPALAVQKLALAALLRLLPQHPELRMGLLPLFMCALRQPGTPAALCQQLLLHAIPSLASAADAYATSRVVAVVSGIWRQCREDRAPPPPPALAAAGWAERCPRVLRLCCLAFRSWANVVVRNPRVWHDLKPAVTQFVEAKKAARPGALLDSAHEYEWTVLVTMRDLVQHDPDRYAEQILPLVFSLVEYALERLGASSVALLVDTARICVAARAADVRSVWETVVAKAADRWLALARGGEAGAAPALESLARFLSLVGTHGENTDAYAEFRRDVMVRYVAWTCGFAAPASEDPDAPGASSSSAAPPPAPALEPRTRDCFLAALAAFPADEVLPLIPGTPSQAVHALLGEASRGQSAAEVARAGGTADLLALLLDNEVRFMRRSLLRGGSTFAQTAADDDDDDDGNSKGADDAAGGPGQRQSWAQSNLGRSQWVCDVLEPELARAGTRYWQGGRLGAGLAPGPALATMVGPPEEARGTGADVGARLRALLVDASLTDHWCMRSSAADGWQMWFAKALRGEAQAGDGAGAGGAAALVEEALAVLRDALETSHIPARMENALCALAGLVRAAEQADPALGSEAAARVGALLAALQILPHTQPRGAFWQRGARAHNEGVLAAAVECLGQAALTNSHDTAMLGRVAQFLMAGLAGPPGGAPAALPPLVVQALGRALARLHALLAGGSPGAPAASGGSGGDVVAVEAGDIRRCVERLDVLRQPAAAAAAPAGEQLTVDVGSVGLALALAAMHRHWIARCINPAMAERNGTPQASQALRTVAHTLAQAFECVRLAEAGQWTAQSIPSLYYLCFVWPPRPILQRHVELHARLFVVTPERAWQAAARLVQRLWAPADGSSGSGSSSNSGVRCLDLINHAEIAAATLAYHLLMTARQSAAHAAYRQLVAEYSDWARDEAAGGAALAANERSALRANRTVALAILLGVPLHGVAGTTTAAASSGSGSGSGSHLPEAQRRCQPVLLGIGSVKFGSTAWLRAPEAELQRALGALMSCSGLAEHDAAPAGPGEAPLRAGGADVGDVRVVRIASFVLGVLQSQAAQAARLLLLLDAKAAEDAPGAAAAAAAPGARPAAADAAPPADDVPAVADEPKTLGHLPAPTSWCRALWEATSELAEALDGGAGAETQSVEARLAYLLSAVLRATRPFPVVDSRKVLERLVGAHLRRAQPGTVCSARMPLLLLVVRVASKLSPTMHSMAQFLGAAALQIVARAVELARQEPALCSRWVDAAPADTLPAIALACVGEPGLGRILSLSGLAAGQPEPQPGAAASASDGDGDEDALPGWTSTAERSARLTRADVVRIVGSEALYAQQQLAAAVAQTTPRPSRHAEAAAPAKTMLETDAARMFQLMSRVAVPAPKGANSCAALLAVLFAGRWAAAPGDEHPAVLALQARALATLQAAVGASADAAPSREVTRDAARADVAAEVAALVAALCRSGRLGSEQRLLLWGGVGVAHSGANAAAGRELLAAPAQDASDGEFGGLAGAQALVLQRWVGAARPAKQGRAPLLSPRGAAADWLKRTFKEWARRAIMHHRSQSAAADGHAPQGNLSSDQDDGLWRCLQPSLEAVAGALFAGRTAGGRPSDAETREWIVLSLDMVILAASLARGKGDRAPPGMVDRMLLAATVHWLLPLLTGHRAAAAAAADDDDNSQAGLLETVARELLEYVELGSPAAVADAGLRPNFSVQLRTRALGLLDLAGSPASRRGLRAVLAGLAVLGRVPADDIGRALL
ncbi:hypothetical protein H4R18_004381 [Coemansia javaensis]|uniref:Uncharacterized protein n=1 Tax=Coemansia javaensis TaxID=2761396 RepID=A0A9W8HBT8_9FUNG|nr:hypothetical protein H4R18_004381 [Coemansia javaensis]